MNITVSENASLSLTVDTFHVTTLLPNLISMSLRLPINIYILQLIMSGNLVTSELYAFIEAIFEVLGLYDLIGVVASVFPFKYFMMLKDFFLGFILTGRPCLLTLICTQRYLAVIKPVAFLRLKTLKYKLAMSGIIWLWTLVSCVLSFMFHDFKEFAVWQVITCSLVNFYCCIATLLALKKPGPGEGHKQGEGMSNAKRRAFSIMLVITVSAFVMYVPLVLVYFLRMFLEKQYQDSLNACYVLTAAAGFVQALLFLQRSGKLPFIKLP